jgi:malonyl-CoA decarboxylase
MADSSAKGLAQSYGMMVNYLYDPRTIDANSENYALHGEAAASPGFRELLREPRV